MTIKNKMVTREQYDKVESSLANKHAAWKWATDQLDLRTSELAAAEMQVVELTGKLDTAELDFALVSQIDLRTSELAAAEMQGSKKITNVAWAVVAVLAILSALQSIVIFRMLLS